MYSKETYPYKILSLLLTKYERSLTNRKGAASKQRPQFSFAGSVLEADYYDEMDYRKREMIHAALKELEDKGVVEVGWAKFKEGIEVRKVYLNVDQVEKAYELTGQVPKGEKIAALLKLLGPLVAHPWDWVQRWVGEAQQSLAEYRQVTGIDMDDQEAVRDFVAVLQALPSIDGVVLKRVFSQSVLHDSKRFEQVVERRLLSVYKLYGPVEYEKDEEYLDSLGIVDHPKLSRLAGPLRFRVKGAVTDVGSLPGGIGLSDETVEAMEIESIEAKRIICVENLTSYVQMVQAIENSNEDEEGSSASTLVIYIGGFPHRSLQKLLSKIAKYVARLGTTEAPKVYHWGDLDYGGIQIFEYLKQLCFPDLLPYKMDVITYRKYAEMGISFSSSYAEKLKVILQDDRYKRWHPLIDVMLETGKRVEQECIR
jgi:hypothetical protein